jgi:hypothetical protein
VAPSGSSRCPASRSVGALRRCPRRDHRAEQVRGRPHRVDSAGQDPSLAAGARRISVVRLTRSTRTRGVITADTQRAAADRLGEVAPGDSRRRGPGGLHPVTEEPGGCRLHPLGTGRVVGVRGPDPAVGVTWACTAWATVRRRPRVADGTAERTCPAGSSSLIGQEACSGTRTAGGPYVLHRSSHGAAAADRRRTGLPIVGRVHRGQFTGRCPTRDTGARAWSRFRWETRHAPRRPRSRRGGRVTRQQEGGGPVGAHVRDTAVGDAPGLVLDRAAPESTALSGRQLLALATSLRARGLRGLDVLRRSQDRAPPAPA